MYRAVVIAVLALAACTAPRSQRCKQVCAREAECLETAVDEQTFDETECVAACTALERAEQTRGFVEAHAECVTKAVGCPQILACSPGRATPPATTAPAPTGLLPGSPPSPTGATPEAVPAPATDAGPAITSDAAP